MATNHQLDAIVIGASAGGIEALEVLIKSIPEGFMLPIFIVLHLPPDKVSLLTAIFSIKSLLPVQEAQDKELIKPGVIYFAPPDYHLLIEPDYRTSLSSDAAVNYSRPSIDVLFDSAAYAYHERLLGIILTGASNDGAEGALVIHSLGGKIWIQNPAEARSPIMPMAAIAKVKESAVYSLQEMANLLARLKTSNYSI